METMENLFEVLGLLEHAQHRACCQWRTEEGVRGLEPLPLAYDLRNKRIRKRQNMVFSTEKFSGKEA